MNKALKQAVNEARSELEQFQLANVHEKANPNAMSYKIAQKCAGRADIFNPAVLSKNKLNHNFILHIRTLEIDGVAEMLSKVLSPLMEQEDISVRIVTNYYGTNFKIISNVAIGGVIDALKPVILYKDSYQRANGEELHIYKFSIKLTF